MLTAIKTFTRKKTVRIAGNVIFFGLLTVLLFNPDAKAWVLQRLLSVGLFKAGISKEQKQQEARPLPGSFMFADEKGAVLPTADLKGKVVLINFWATWCPPCRAEMPSLDRLYRKLQTDDRFVFLFVNEDDDAAKALTFLRNEN